MTQDLKVVDRSVHISRRSNEHIALGLDRLTTGRITVGPLPAGGYLKHAKGAAVAIVRSPEITARIQCHRLRQRIRVAVQGGKTVASSILFYQLEYRPRESKSGSIEIALPVVPSKTVRARIGDRKVVQHRKSACRCKFKYGSTTVATAADGSPI